MPATLNGCSLNGLFYANVDAHIDANVDANIDANVAYLIRLVLNTQELHANPPELHAAVDAAEAGLVVDVEVRHQLLQGVHGLQTRDARLSHRRAELLTAQRTYVAFSTSG